MHDDSFVVGGRRISQQGGPVSQLVLRDGSTLVAGDNQLWRVRCNPTAVDQLIASPSASVRDGRLTSDEQTFVYADGSGIAAFDLTTRATREVYKPPDEKPPGFCGMIVMKGDSDPQPHAFDDLRGLADDGRTLIIERRWGCHYPDAYEYRLVDWADAAKAKLHPARPIHAVAADAKRAIWFGDSGGLWRSTDRGATWKRIPIKGDKGAVVDLFADTKRPGHLVVRTANHTAVAEGVRGSAFGGPVWRTRDGGATWSKLGLPEPAMTIGEAVSLVVTDGNVDHVIVATGVPEEDEELPEAPPEGEEGPLIQRTDQGANGFRLPGPTAGDPPSGWRATTNGKTWTKSATPSSRLRTVTVGDDTYEPTGDGLYRTRAGKRELVTPLLAKPYLPDAY